MKDELMMKINALLTKPLIIASLMMSTSVLADEMQLVVPDNTENISSSEEECGIDLLPPPQKTSMGEVSYVSGGICTGGVEQMKSMAKDFPLEVVLVEKAEEDEKENYIADVTVKINDAKDNLILDVVTEGPFLLVDLPSGSYQITAEFHNVIKTRKVKINRNKHERVVLLWPAQPQGE
jgi:hypothetical protein